MSEKLYQDEDWLSEKYTREGLTQDEMANMAGCSQKTISRWLTKTGVKEKRSVATGANRKNGKCKTPATFGTYIFHEGQGAYETWAGGNNDMLSVHRLLAVAEWGVEAVKGKVVHHKNEITWDNRPENLELMTASEHTELHHERRAIREREDVDGT